MFELKHALGFTFNSHMYVLVKGNEFVNTPNEIYKRPLLVLKKIHFKKMRF